MEVSDVPEVTEPVVNIPTNNDPITVSNKSGYRKRSGRMSKSPVKLNLLFYSFFFLKEEGCNRLKLYIINCLR